jgi:hypothetical protein
MSRIELVRSKVQRILTDNFGSVRVDRDDDFLLRFGKTRCFVSVDECIAAVNTIVRIDALVLRSLKLTKELYEWAAVDGQDYKIGSCFIWRDESGKVGSLMYGYGLAVDDLDASELILGIGCVGFTADLLATELQPTFGDETFF